MITLLNSSLRFVLDIDRPVGMHIFLSRLLVGRSPPLRCSVARIQIAIDERLEVTLGSILDHTRHRRLPANHESALTLLGTLRVLCDHVQYNIFRLLLLLLSL